MRHLVIALGLLLHALPAHAQFDSLTARLRAGRLTMSATAAGELTGTGADLLMREARRAQFTLLGEEHGVAEIPAFATALFKQLVPAGYTHVAIETSAALAAAMQEQLRAGDAQYKSFLEQHHPAIAFFTRTEEAAFARAALQLLPRVPDVLWGLDYDITGDRYAIRRLREIAPNAAARAVADRFIAQGDSALRVALATKNPGATMMFGGPDHLYAELKAAYRPARGSEAENILWVLEETRAINGLFFGGQNYASNLRRAQLNKAQFMRYYRAAERRAGKAPRVLFKFGASHMYRGLTQTNVFDLGTQASELAEMNGSTSFHILIVAGPETQVAVMDPTVFRSVSSPAAWIASSWMKPFLDATDPKAWTVFDLRPLRAANQARRYGALPDPLNRVLYAFDAVVVLGGSTPQHDLVRE